MINLLVDKYIKPIMSVHGFRKDKLTWNRGEGDIVYVFNIQKSQWNDKNDINFTINLGVCVKSARKIYHWNENLPQFIHEINCLPSLRVGDLLDNYDHWWNLKSADDVDKVGRELHEIIQNKCIPFLDNLDSLNKIVSLIEENPRLRRYPAELLYYAIMKHLIGSFDEANQILNSMLANKKLESWHDKIREISDRLNGLPAKIK